MSLTAVIWLFPVAFLLHDVEEIVTWSWWMRRAGQHVFDIPILRGRTAKSTRQMTVAVLVMFALVLSSTLAAILSDWARPALWYLSACLCVLLLHAFVHIGTSIRYRMYSPGVVGAVLLCLPYGAWALSRLMGAGLLSWSDLASTAAIGLLGAGPSLFLAHTVGTALVKE